MQTDMISEVLSAVELFRGTGAQNQTTIQYVASVFHCDQRHPSFFYLVAALIGQFDLLERQISQSTHLTNEEKTIALEQVRNLSRFLQPERLVRPWNETREQMFQQQNFGIKLMRHTLASEFPMQSLSQEDVQTLLPKVKKALSEVVNSGAPTVVIQVLTNAIEAVLHILEHFRFYGASVLSEKVLFAFATAESYNGAPNETTRKAAHFTIGGLAAIALFLVQANEAIRAVGDWRERASAALEYVVSHSPPPLLPAPNPPLPEALPVPDIMKLSPRSDNQDGREPQ